VTPIVWLLIGEFFAVAAAFILGRLHADEWALHAIARARGGQWYQVRRACPGCGRRVHVMRRSQVAADAGLPPALCCSCASGRHR
jgi:hypothetical protein